MTYLLEGRRGRFGPCEEEKAKEDPAHQERAEDVESFHFCIIRAFMGFAQSSDRYRKKMRENQAKGVLCKL
jgi:hypothetical protein